MMMHGLQERVLNMENALQQILTHLTPQHVATPSIAPSVMSTAEIINEWDAPWSP
jgi:hypothetical protein